MAPPPLPHHLIISLPPVPAHAPDEAEIFRAHALTEGDIEPAVLSKARLLGPEALCRAARLAAANRALREHGFAPLLMEETEDKMNVDDASKPAVLGDAMRMLPPPNEKKKPQPRPRKPSKTFKQPPSPAALEAATAFGLDADEYTAIHGTHGIALGLSLDASAYQHFRQIIRRQLPDAETLTLCRRYARRRFRRCVLTKRADI